MKRGDRHAVQQQVKHLEADRISAKALVIEFPIGSAPVSTYQDANLDEFSAGYKCPKGKSGVLWICPKLLTFLSNLCIIHILVMI